MDVFFNELSLNKYPHSDIAKLKITNLINLFKEAKAKGCQKLRFSEGSYNAWVADGYTISLFATDRTNDEVLRKLLLAHITSHPPIEKSIESSPKLYEFKCESNACIGLGAAFIFNSIAVSLEHESLWKEPQIQIVCTAIDEESKLDENTVLVRHASIESHLNHHSDWFEEEIRNVVVSGLILWEKRTELCPNLVFSESVRSQLIACTLPSFRQVRNILLSLQKYCSTWVAGSFDHKAFSHRPSPESESRKQKLSEELSFLFEGNRRMCSWHFRFTPNAGRIHFDPSESDKKCYIGYIGEKIQ